MTRSAVARASAWISFATSKCTASSVRSGMAVSIETRFTAPSAHLSGNGWQMRCFWRTSSLKAAHTRIPVGLWQLCPCKRTWSCGRSRTHAPPWTTRDVGAQDGGELAVEAFLLHGGTSNSWKVHRVAIGAVPAGSVAERAEMELSSAREGKVSFSWI